MAESFSREKLRHAPQKEGGREMLCDLPPVLLLLLLLFLTISALVASPKKNRALLGKITTVKYYGIFRGNW